MPSIVALSLGFVLIAIALRGDRKAGAYSNSALLWPTLWYMVVSSRPLGIWLYLWGIPVPGGSGDPTDGNAVDRLFYTVLTVIGLRILARRHFAWGTLLRQNVWLTGLLVLMFASILWSQYPYVSFKRFIKVVGSVVMALVVLTEERPFDAVLTVLRRGLYVHLPMSIICVKYYREIGVNFDWSGAAQYWQGISTSKNTLGQVAMLGTLVFFWEIRRQWAARKWRKLHLLYLLMAVYLLKGSEDSFSLTSLVVAVFAVTIFGVIHAMRQRAHAIRPFVYLVFGGTIALITLVLTHSVVGFSEDSVFGRVITTLGRDITLTDRTYIWSDVYAVAAASPLVGIGFGGFWIGRLANIPWNTDMTWVLGQAHSGYIDTYLQIGLIGAAVLAGVLLTAVPRAVAALSHDFEFASFRIAILLTIIFVNITESTFLRGDHQLWFVMQLVIWTVPSGPWSIRSANAISGGPASSTAREPKATVGV